MPVGSSAAALAKSSGDMARVMGVSVNPGDTTPETPEMVAGRLRAALEVLPPERIVAAPDCGMKYLPHEVALAKLRAFVEGTEMVRAGL